MKKENEQNIKNTAKDSAQIRDDANKKIYAMEYRFISNLKNNTYGKKR